MKRHVWVLLLISTSCQNDAQEIDKRRIWEEAPVSATSVHVKDANSIRIRVRNGTIDAIHGATLETTEDAGRYTLKSNIGTFRLLVHGDLSSEIKEIVADPMLPYEALRKAFELTPQSTEKRFWILRATMMPIGAGVRLNYFETPTKKGFIAGHLDGNNRLLMLFDKTGTFLIELLPIEPLTDDWEPLVNELSIEIEDE